ncbi:MAG: ABC transporter permease [Bacilli bacterium]|nr:ABC transporter permease [Bacilli bacterium]
MKRLYGLVSFIVFWYLISLITKVVIPYPHDVIKSFITLYPKELHIHTLASSRRLIIGLVISVVLGVHLGIWLGLSKKAEALLQPIIYILYPIPKAALLPIFIILFGIGDLTKIILIVIIVIFPIIINIKDAIQAIPNEYFYVAKSLNLSRSQMYKDMLIPAILPKLFTTLRISIGIAIAVLYLSENFATFEGLGYYITIYMTNKLKLFCGILALSLVGYILFLIVEFLEKKLCKWV